MSFSLSIFLRSTIAASIAPLGALCGGLTSGIPLAKLGRKKTLLLAGFVFILGFSGLALSSLIDEAKGIQLALILVSRMLTGYSTGLSIPGAQIYVSEASEAGVRGALGSLPAVMMALGMLAAYVAGSALHWPFLSASCVFFPLLMLVTVSLLPETPAWLMANQKEDEAEKSLSWLRGGQDKDIR